MNAGSFKKGNPGRPKGVPDRRSTWYNLQKKCEEKGFDVFDFMISMIENPTIENHVRLSAAKEIACRLLPPVKAIEMRLDEDSKQNVEEITQLHKKMMEMLIIQKKEY